MAGPNNYAEEGLRDLLQKAIDLDRRGLRKEACRLYISASKVLLKLYRVSTLPKVRQLYYDRAQECVERVIAITRRPATDNESSVSALPSQSDSTQQDSSPVDSDDRILSEMVADTIIRERPGVKMSEVAGLDDAKQAIYEAIVFPIKHPELFKGKARQPWRGILLYGPAGTGKTLLVKAVASEINATFFNVSAGNIVSKWLGESERLVMKLFELARKHQPSIIFIDEIDSIGNTRSNDDVGGERRMKTQLLTELQGLNSSPNERVTLVAATNLPWEIDFALLSRFERKIYVPLPNENARAEILRIHMTDVEIADDVDYAELARLTEWYSGRDLSIVCREAAMGPIREVMGQSSTEGEMKVRPVSMNDFLRAIKKIVPMASPDDVRRYHQWMEGP